MLTENVINNLQRYFGKAIWDNINTDVSTMEKAVWTSYLHSTSTDELPRHHYCPDGDDSWCFYNRPLANSEVPPSHKTKKLFLAKIAEKKLQGIVDIYRDLTKPELLEKCLKGRIQNPNESLHFKIWSKCSKRKFAGPDRVSFST